MGVRVGVGVGGGGGIGGAGFQIHLAYPSGEV